VKGVESGVGMTADSRLVPGRLQPGLMAICESQLVEGDEVVGVKRMGHSGASLIVWAIAEGRKMAAGVDRFLRADRSAKAV